MCVERLYSTYIGKRAHRNEQSSMQSVVVVAVLAESWVGIRTIVAYYNNTDRSTRFFFLSPLVDYTPPYGRRIIRFIYNASCTPRTEVTEKKINKKKKQRGATS